MNHVLQYTQLKFKFDLIMKLEILGSIPSGVANLWTDYYPKSVICTFNSFCFKHFCVVVLHLYSNWHVKDLAMTSNHICG